MSSSINTSAIEHARQHGLDQNATLASNRVSKRVARSNRDSSLIVGIVMIVVFLGLFVLEFSRILSLTG